MVLYNDMQLCHICEEEWNIEFLDTETERKQNAMLHGK